jgi:hypothetical protein
VVEYLPCKQGAKVQFYNMEGKKRKEGRREGERKEERNRFL